MIHRSSFTSTWVIVHFPSSNSSLKRFHQTPSIVSFKSHFLRRHWFHISKFFMLKSHYIGPILLLLIGDSFEASTWSHLGILGGQSRKREASTWSHLGVLCGHSKKISLILIAVRCIFFLKLPTYAIMKN
jgi:hypothetical protein